MILDKFVQRSNGAATASWLNWRQSHVARLLWRDPWTLHQRKRFLSILGVRFLFATWKGWLLYTCVSPTLFSLFNVCVSVSIFFSSDCNCLFISSTSTSPFGFSFVSALLVVSLFCVIQLLWGTRLPPFANLMRKSTSSCAYDEILFLASIFHFLFMNAKSQMMTLSWLESKVKKYSRQWAGQMEE